MEQSWYSVEQVAGRLGLHVRTVRGYIREGRLAAVRIGKQYRVARSDLDVFTGRPGDIAPPRVEVSAVVEFDGVSAKAADRLSTLVVAGAQFSREERQPLRLQTVYDDSRGRLKVIILGGVGDTADVLRTIDDILRSENDMFLTQPGATAADGG